MGFGAADVVHLVDEVHVACRKTWILFPGSYKPCRWCVLACYPTLGKWRQGVPEFKVTLGNTGSSRLAWAIWDCISKHNNVSLWCFSHTWITVLCSYLHTHALTHIPLFSLTPLVYFLPSSGSPSAVTSYIFLKLDSTGGKMGYLTFLVSHCLLLSALIRVETKTPSLRPSFPWTKKPILVAIM